MRRAGNMTGKNASVSKGIACAAMSCALVMGCLGLAGCSGEKSGDTDGSWAAGESAGTLIADVANMDREYTSRDKDPSYDAATATRISLNGTTASVEGEGANADGSTVTVSAEGTYVISGTLTDGQVVVNAADTDKVQLVLAGASIHNEDGPTIYIKQADKCFITLADGSTNALTDGAEYALEEESDEPYATLFSNDDLTINGSGALSVEAAYRHAVCSKDDLVITGGTFSVTAAEDALRGRDCVKIADGTFDIKSGEDAIKSNNDEDPVRGFVSIDGGTLAIDAGDDAVHGEFAVFVEGGQLDVSACYEGLEAQQVYVSGGNVSIVSSDDSINASSPGDSAAAGEDKMAGGIADNGAPAAGEEGMRRGMPGKAGDQGAPDASDGFGDRQGNMRQDDITPPNTNGEAPSDMEGTPLDATPQGEAPAHNDMGDVPQNMAGAGALGTGGGMPGEYEEGCLIEINGGEISLVTEGDGVDSNGDFTMNGGALFISGPTNSGNGSLDVAGSATMNGGTVVMAGSAGMAQSFSGGSQAFLSAKASGEAGEAIAITGPTGEEVASFTPKARYSLVIASSPQMEAGTTYTVAAGQSSVEAQASTGA